MKPLRPLPILRLLFSLNLLPCLASALELAPPFTDHAVLQREVAVPVWGWDDQPGATVTVAFGGQLQQTRVNAAGTWRADLDAMPANATGGDLVVTRGNTSITLRDVVVGEVWLASGQSNMEWGMHNARTYDEERAKPSNPLIRHLRVDHVGADLPAGRVSHSGWQVAGPDTLGPFTAVGYFFAQQLSEKLQVPVGLLNASWGGTPIESWIPEPTLRTSRSWPALNKQWQDALKVWPERYAAQPGLEAAWQKAQEELHTKGTPVTMPWPRPPMGPGSGFAPARLYNGMIMPFVPYALRGALWYQGESNVGRHRDYVELLPAMIRSWRASWPLGDFPFLVVQLPNYSDNGKATGRAWALLRESQEKSVQQVPAAAVAVIIDQDEPDNLHPVDKRSAGDRLARLALARVHRVRDVVDSGPVVQAVTREGAALRVRFAYADGLKSTGPEVTGFEIAGANQTFHPATARIDGSSVIVSAATVSDPVAVRYAFINAPAASLANGAGLPAAPFRTDS
ncbi:MAG TPA: sialate O-acetylesterase, partial [Lacunisphaera sp.]|nr:sialate O-acetylesterase [Lacunisphaera sp.]